MVVEVRLYATLREHAPPESSAGVFSMTLPEDSNISTLLAMLAIEPAKVHLRMVNGVSAGLETVLKEYDRIGLFPPVGGG